MAFDRMAIARWLGRPVTLYRFDRQHLSWRFTSADSEIPLGGDVFAPVPGLRRSGIVSGGNERQAEVKVTVPFLLDPAASQAPPTQAFGANWRPYPPGDEVLLTVIEGQAGGTDADFRVVWTGHVIQPEFTDTDLTLTCAPGRMGARKSGMLPRWCRSCWVPLGSQGRGMCNVDLEAFAADAELAAIDRLQLRSPTFATFGNGRLWGGFVRWERSDGLIERRDIRAHTGDTITINYGALDLAPGTLVRVYPGCRHNETDCRDYFGNLDNYPGIKTIPIKTLFDGNRRIQ